ncbi:MAG: 1-deoxy-D-xylulose-5-phosphate synthase [Clostridia bacterium]|nr:1-deoxy-D-xylulose-5-phosphate synthase [Clostridia bacterium]MBR0445489.1 1-deoxy-D-xylulose-5-phosphate synthase [Clostridia bacterium]
MSTYPILDSVNSIEDLKALPEEQLDALAEEIRSFMVEHVARTGGHLASSLGAVDIIIAMHRVFDSPTDRIVFDVGHQAYAHKILTGRKDAFETLRQKDGLSGFPKREESEHDAFNTGHASTAISAALGYARAKQIRHAEGTVVALIGDGAMTGGMAMEAMNDAGSANLPIIVILNDNDMSIAPNVGAVHRQLINLRLSDGYVQFKRKLVRMLDTGATGRWLTRHMENFKNRVKSFLLPNRLFEEMGFHYYGPIDGHDIRGMIRAFERARKLSGAVVVHVTTKKGKGYAFAEADPERFHGIGPFDPATGKTKPSSGKSNSEVFGETMCRMAEENPCVTAITAAMPRGTGLQMFAKTFPDRFFDVGICEEHAVTMAAGMAAGGLRPVVAIYATFLQRAYDQILHDVCLQNLPVVFAVDRAGLVGSDGETHQGVYDAAFLSTLPGLDIYCPATQEELSAMLELAVALHRPAAVLYNRGSLMRTPIKKPIEFGKWETLGEIAPVTVVAAGDMVEAAIPVARELGAGLVSARFLSPVDEMLLKEMKEKCRRIITVEDRVNTLGAIVASRVMPVTVTALCVPNTPIRQATTEQQRLFCGISADDIRKAVLEAQKD